MRNLRRLIMQLSDQEQELCSTQFLAPCVLGGKVQTKVSHLVYKFAPDPKDFVGWAVLQPLDEKTAKVVEEASLPMISEYLKLFKAFRLRLAYRLESQTWLAYPVNEADMRQRLGSAKPVAVNLVTEAVQLEQIIARYDGGSFWFEDVDRSADPIIAEELRIAFNNKVLAKDLRLANLTPEMRTTYGLLENKERREEERQIWLHEQQLKRQEQKLRRLQGSDERRLSEALRVGGNAKLHQFRDQGNFWVVDWFTKDGERHTSAISKGDLTVISSGICLSGYDRNFDLQSLVKVIERRDDW